MLTWLGVVQVKADRWFPGGSIAEPTN